MEAIYAPALSSFTYMQHYVDSWGFCAHEVIREKEWRVESKLKERECKSEFHQNDYKHEILKQ